MEIVVTQTGITDVKSFRELFLYENKFQFVHNKCHEFGWADIYLFSINKHPIGYGSVWGKDKRQNRDTVFEFYLVQDTRKLSTHVFASFLKACRATSIQCQTNDPLLTSMLFESANNISAESILFEDQFQTAFEIPGLQFSRRGPDDNAVTNLGEYVLRLNGETVATGGFVRNYNFPYIDIFYEVNVNFRRNGYATFMVQELKKEAYRMGKVPSARCNPGNIASKATLLKAGFIVCGFIVSGDIIR